MSSMEEKWRANSDKVAFARSFPGRLHMAEDAVGRTVAQVVRIPDEAGLSVIVFADGMFFVTRSAGEVSAAEIVRGISAVRPHLETRYPEAFARLETLAAADRELTRQARLVNILGAIRSNIERIPELYQEIPQLLESLSNRSGADDSPDLPPNEGA